MKYKIKIGKMYVKEIYLDKDNIETEFIDSIELTANRDYDYMIKVSESEQELYREKLTKILQIESGNPNDIITFEEVINGNN